MRAMRRSRRRSRRRSSARGGRASSSGRSSAARSPSASSSCPTPSRRARSETTSSPSSCRSPPVLSPHAFLPRLPALPLVRLSSQVTRFAFPLHTSLAQCPLLIVQYLCSATLETGQEKERARASERGCEVTRSRYGKRSVPFDRPAASSIFAVLTPKWIAFLGSVAARTSPSRLASRRRSIFSPTPSRKR